jgi:hypothetical protein
LGIASHWLSAQDVALCLAKIIVFSGPITGRYQVVNSDTACNYLPITAVQNTCIMLHCTGNMLAGIYSQVAAVPR